MRLTGIVKFGRIWLAQIEAEPTRIYNVPITEEQAMDLQAQGAINFLCEIKISTLKS